VTRVRKDKVATVKAGARAGPSAGLAATSGNYVVHAGTTETLTLSSPVPTLTLSLPHLELPLQTAIRGKNCIVASAPPHTPKKYEQVWSLQ